MPTAWQSPFFRAVKPTWTYAFVAAPDRLLHRTVQIAGHVREKDRRRIVQRFPEQRPARFPFDVDPLVGALAGEDGDESDAKLPVVERVVDDGGDHADAAEDGGGFGDDAVCRTADPVHGGGHQTRRLAVEGFGARRFAHEVGEALHSGYLPSGRVGLYDDGFDGIVPHGLSELYRQNIETGESVESHPVLPLSENESPDPDQRHFSQTPGFRNRIPFVLGSQCGSSTRFDPLQPGKAILQFLQMGLVHQIDWIVSLHGLPVFWTAIDRNENKKTRGDTSGFLMICRFLGKMEGKPVAFEEFWGSDGGSIGIS